MSRSRDSTAAATHPGRRGYQEDANLVDGGGNPVVLAVADGMGGHAAGDVASQIVITALTEAAHAGSLSTVDDDGLQEAARQANTRILAYGDKHVESAGLGSTLVAAVVEGRQALVAHAGDSRAYLVSNDELVQLTRDHSAVQDALDSGTIGENDVNTSPYRHAILRNIGDRQFSGLDVSWIDLPEGSILLLTSDGTHGFLTEAEILEHLAGTKNLAIGLEHLLRLAYHNGSDDNMTLVAFEAGPFPRSTAASQIPPAIDPPAKANTRRRSPAWVAITVAGILVAVIGSLVWLLSQRLPAEASGMNGAVVPVTATPLLETPVPMDDSGLVSEGPVWTTPVPQMKKTPLPTPTPSPESEREQDQVRDATEIDREALDVVRVPDVDTPDPETGESTAPFGQPPSEAGLPPVEPVVSPIPSPTGGPSATEVATSESAPSPSTATPTPIERDSSR